MKKITLTIDGMTCSACSSGLEKYLNKQEGIKKASVNLVLASASIEYDEKIKTIEEIEKYIQEAGFKSLGEFKEIQTDKNNKKRKILLIISTILAITLMILSMDYIISYEALSKQNRLIVIVCITVLFLGYGFEILKNGFKNLIHTTPNMDTLVGIGVITSFLYSLYHMISFLKGNDLALDNIYFESSAIIIYFMKLGRYIDGKSKNKTKEAIAKLVSITPNEATIKDQKETKVVTLDEIKKGDIVICSPGSKIAVDGVILKGKSHVDESFITGESKPVEKDIGDMVIAGSMNYDGYIEYKAVKIGKESTISEIVRLVVEATNTKAPISKTIDKIASIFVPVILGIACLTFFYYYHSTKDISLSVNTFVTVLVVACPCTLGLATPLAMIVSEGLCVENGILVKKNEILETARKIDTIVFDKTGTLTYGKPKIARIYNYTKLTDKVLLQLIGSIEEASSHPIAQAFKDYMSERKIDPLEVEEYKEISGLGVMGIIDNKKYYIGNRKLMDKYNIRNKFLEDEEKLSEKGNSIVYLSNEKEVLGLIGINDILRKEASKVIKELNDRGIETIMLTGDHEQTAQLIANKLGINQVIADVLPQEKTKIIQELKQHHKVMMCGDGINDSPSLATADIGVSITEGTDIAMDAADVILTKNDLKCIINLLDISKRTIKNIKQNLFWAFFYNMLMIPLAIGVLRKYHILINPMIASLAMVLSSMTVILNTLRLKKIKIK